MDCSHRKSLEMNLVLDSGAKMNYLVTGAAGFIGSKLCSLIAQSGHSVTAVDNFSSYYSRNLKEKRVEHFLNVKNINFQVASLENSTSVKKIFSNQNFDSVIHLAAQPGVRLPIGQYSRYVEDNLVAFENVLHYAVKSRTGNFLYASSSSVYGNSALVPYSEKQTDLVPVSFYGATKLANELFALPMIRNSETKARGLRFFTVYGPWGRPDMAYFRIVANALDKAPFSIYGDGSVIRDFTYIDDTVESIIKLDLELQNRPHGFADIVNIGGGKPSTLNEMIREIGFQLKVEFNFSKQEFNSNDVMATNADSSYLFSLTGQSPQISLKQGIAHTLDWALSGEILAKLNEWTTSVK